jgi:Four helix bundle sensory module for signal transduction
MSKFVPTIKFRLAMAFGTSAVLAAVLGLVGMFGQTQLKSDITSPLSTSIVSLAQLSDIRSSTLDISANFARIRANPVPDYTARILPGIRADLAAIDRAWSGYYSASFNGSKEREIAEGLARDLVRFKAQSAAVVSLIDGQSLGNIGDRIDRTGDSADALGKSLIQAEAFKVADAKRRIDENSMAFNNSFSF